ncbi:MAG: hypothetical protein ACMG6E_01810 [Candidatus Roizmanbacteria bacterium]
MASIEDGEDEDNMSKAFSDLMQEVSKRIKTDLPGKTGYTYNIMSQLLLMDEVVRFLDEKGLTMNNAQLAAGNPEQYSLELSRRLGQLGAERNPQVLFVPTDQFLRDELFPTLEVTEEQFLGLAEAEAAPMVGRFISVHFGWARERGFIETAEDTNFKIVSESDVIESIIIGNGEEIVMLGTTGAKTGYGVKGFWSELSIAFIHGIDACFMPDEVMAELQQLKEI